MDTDRFPESFGPPKSFFVSVIRSSWLMLFAALTFMGISWFVLEEYLRDRGEERFNNHVQELSEAVTRRMMAYEQVLRGGVGLFLSSNGVTRSEWQIYVANARLSDYYPGIQGLGFAQLVMPTSLDELHSKSNRRDLLIFASHPQVIESFTVLSNI